MKIDWNTNAVAIQRRLLARDLRSTASVVLNDPNAEAKFLSVLLGHHRFGDERCDLFLCRWPNLDNGRGASIDFDYESTTALRASNIASGQDWATVTPQIEDVVVATTATTGAGQSIENQYTYFDPAYDAWRRQPKGFRKVRRTESSNGATNTRITDTKFLIHTCQDVVGECTTNSDYDLQMSLPPLPVEELVSANDGTRLSLTRWMYTAYQFTQGPDGRTVRYPYVEQTDIYRYGDQPGGSTTSATVTSLEWTGADPGQEVPTHHVVSDTVTTATPQSGPYAHMRGTTAMDIWGNATTVVDFGQIQDNGTPLDHAIQTNVTPWPSTVDRGLPETVTVLPFGLSNLPSAQARTFDYVFDSAGNLTNVNGHLSGTLALDRFHANPAKSTAPVPADASADGIIQLGHF